MLIMFSDKRRGGAAARQRQRYRQEIRKKVHSSHYSSQDSRLTSAEQSINPASVCFMRLWV